ncbi:MAG: hypothetical protein LBP83_02880 [Dysgonamonadaceae bacterium]|jgi:hypothetical protein|nr:hypothetical protein [Dysgonamonadaceae bacterium]
MLKADALVLLVSSLSKTEKKTFRKNRKTTDYIVLYDIIEKEKNISLQDLKTKFEERRKNANFNIAVSYLYKLLLNNLLSLRENQDNHYFLFLNILKAKILFEKALYEEAFDMLKYIKEKAARMENYYALLYASRLELEYLLFVNLPNISETELLNLHFKVNEVLKNIRRINEQSSLFELLKHRIIYKGNIRSKKQKNSLIDLVISEISIINSSSVDNFETKKLHQLFQSNYLIHVGDYKSAIHSYHELNQLFEINKHLWTNPPFYYLYVLEGILDNLRSIKNYEKMTYFIEQLKNIRYYSSEFQANVKILIFLYELFPLLDKGDFKSSEQLLKQNNDAVLTKLNELNLARQAEVSLYITLIYIGLHNFKTARKTLKNIMIRGKSFYDFPLYRTIRLVNLIIQYEIGNEDVIRFESRSIKRELEKIEKAYQVEHLMLNFLNKPIKGMLPHQKEKMWKKIEPELQNIRNDIYEKQLLKYFDFTAWMESIICKIPLQEVLGCRFQ